MLRISVIESAENAATLHLEGQVAGLWTAELGDTCERLLGERRRLTLDLGDVSLIDRPGLALLADLSRRSVALVRCSPFQEEQLRQTAATTHETTTTTLP
jgi:ABC-type transporter Mla MlaB component